MDFVVGLPGSSGKTVILVMVDRLSKYAHFVALSSTFIAASVAAKFVEEVVRLDGIPKCIVSNCNPRFLSSFWQGIFHLARDNFCDEYRIPPLK